MKTTIAFKLLQWKILKEYPFIIWVIKLYLGMQIWKKKEKKKHELNAVTSEFHSSTLNFFPPEQSAWITLEVIFF